jgi:glycosyltransferase involved in cell wall biosynthesis
MRICFVVGHAKYYTGGAEIQSLRLAHELKARGYTIVYLSFVAKGLEAPKKEELDGITVYHYRERKRFKILDYFRVKRCVEEINADVYYMRASFFAEAFITFLGKKRNRQFLTVWQCPAGRSLIPFVTLRDLVKDKSLLSILANAFDCICQDLLRYYTICNATALVAQTRQNVEIIRHRFHRHSHQILKGIKITSNDKLRKPADRIKVVFLRNIRQRSRIDLFIEVVKKLKVDRIYDFVVIGRIELHKPDLLSLFTENRITYMGQLANVQVQKELESTHILIDTLFEPYGFTTYSNAFLEAWLHKVVVIAFGSNPDGVLSRGDLGYFVQTVSECVDRVRQLTEDRSLLLSVGEKAYRYVQEHHNIGKETDALLNVMFVANTPSFHGISDSESASSVEHPRTSLRNR